MSSPIETLFSNCRCLKCDQPASAKCTCWDIKNPVTLKCEKCSATKVVEDEPDFHGFKEIETLCPKCSTK